VFLLLPAYIGYDVCLSFCQSVRLLSVIMHDCICKLNCVGGEHKPARGRFCCPDLDLGPMNLKVGRDIDILKTYLHTEKEVAVSSRLKVIA